MERKDMIRVIALLSIIAILLFPMPAFAQTNILYCRFEPSGTHIEDGQLKIRLDIFPSETSYCWEARHVLVPDENSIEYLAGYPGEKNDNGYPVDIDTYNIWLSQLPHIWQTNPMLSVFISVNPLVSSEEISNWLTSHFLLETLSIVDDLVSRDFTHDLPVPISHTYRRLYETRLLWLPLRP